MLRREYRYGPALLRGCERGTSSRSRVLSHHLNQGGIGMAKVRLSGRTRLPIAVAAVCAAIATAAVLATAGSAQTSPTSLHLVAKSQKGVGFFPKHRPRQGDRFGFGDKITGDDTGIDRGVCTIIGKNTLCTVQARLSKGSLSLQGFVTERSHNTPIAITGGTGAYNGARGTALVTDTRSATDINVTLLP
jgi:hypothetical protein